MRKFKALYWVLFIHKKQKTSCIRNFKDFRITLKHVFFIVTFQFLKYLKKNYIYKIDNRKILTNFL